MENLLKLLNWHIRHSLDWLHVQPTAVCKFTFSFPMFEGHTNGQWLLSYYVFNTIDLKIVWILDGKILSLLLHTISIIQKAGSALEVLREVLDAVDLQHPEVHC